MQRVEVVRRPPQHATGDKSGPCTCKGRLGTLKTMEVVGRDHLAIVHFDAGGQAGLPMSCLRMLNGPESQNGTEVK
jgi:hypothetical protein